MMKRRHFFFWVGTVLVITSCNGQERTLPQNPVSTPVNARDSGQVKAMFESNSRTADQAKILVQDTHIGELLVVLSGAYKTPDNRPVKLKDLCARSLQDNDAYGLGKVKRSTLEDDSGESLVYLDYKLYSICIESGTGTYLNLKMNKPGMALVSRSGYRLEVGGRISAMEEYFPKEYKRSRTLPETRGVQFTKISLSAFIDASSDTYVYVHHRNGVITEIGTWEQV